MMKLIDYAAALAEQQRKLLQADQRIRRFQDVVNHLTAEIDTTIAFDTTLKNDAQRKAKRLEMMSAAEYRTAVANLQIAQDQRAEIEIDLNLLRNQFSVLKLEKREAIINRELQIIDAAWGEVTGNRWWVMGIGNCLGNCQPAKRYSGYHIANY